jgi:hypothetical protein
MRRVGGNVHLGFPYYVDGQGSLRVYPRPELDDGGLETNMV